MEELAVKIDKIETLLVEANFHQGYRAYCAICSSHDENFHGEAKQILMRFNALRKKQLSIPLTEVHNEETKIYDFCMDSINRFKARHLDEPQPVCYTEYEELLRENQEHIRKTKDKYEDECTNCVDPHKMTLLEQMIAEFKKILERFEKLLRQFAKIRDYERI